MAARPPTTGHGTSKYPLYTPPKVGCNYFQSPSLYLVLAGRYVGLTVEIPPVLEWNQVQCEAELREGFLLEFQSRFERSGIFFPDNADCCSRFRLCLPHGLGEVVDNECRQSSQKS